MLLTRPSPQVLEALANSEHNANFKIILGWLDESLSHVSGALRTAEPMPQIYRAQGAAGILADFMKHTKEARANLTKLSERK